MDIYKIFLDILDKPFAPKCYRELRKYYLSKDLLQEADAISYLIEKKFEKKDEITINNTNNCEK
jgi:hypothetical protein